MAVEIAGTYLHRSAPPLSRIALSPKSVAFAFSSLPHTASRNSPYPIHHSHFIGVPLLPRKRSLRGGGRILASTNSASLDFVDGDDEDDELPLRFDPDAESRGIPDAEARSSGEKYESSPSSSYTSASTVSDPISALPISTSSAMPRDPWPESNGFMPERVKRSANSFHLPLSLRILKRKMRILESEGAEDSTSISVKNAFSSMVFIVREIQSHMILMREALFSSSNLQIQGILARVHDELHASFVWLFQRVFSATPTLMVYLMLLLANFTVFSIAEAPAVAASPPPSQSVSVSSKESQNPNIRFDSSALRIFSIGRSAAVGGGSGGGRPGNPPAVSGAADDGRWDHNRSSSSSSQGDCTISSEAAAEEEVRMWKEIVETAEKMRASDRHEALMDPNTLRCFVSPVTIEAEPDDLSCYSSTELSYRRALSGDPDDPLILSNFAQFLYVVLGDHDRAEEYFKRAARAEPPDAEALSRYANFLWVARKDLGAAEETFLEAIAADPGNSYYSGNYAHFLWSTGGEDTCYPLDDCDA